MCPGNRESGGKRTSGKTRKGNRYIRRALVQVAWAVSHSKDTYLRAKFWRLAGKIGKKKAALAVAHHVLKVIFLMIRDQAHYQELGGTFYDRMDPIRTKNKLVNRLKALGYEVTLTPQQVLPIGPFQARGICQLVDNSGARGSCFSKEGSAD